MASSTTGGGPRGTNLMKKLIALLLLSAGLSANAAWYPQAFTTNDFVNASNAVANIAIAVSGGGGAAFPLADDANFAGFSGTNFNHMLGSNGTVALPVFSFQGDPDTGLFWSGANTVGVAVGGATGTVFTANSVRAPAGTVSQPSFSFWADQDTGMYRLAAGKLAFAADGVEALRIDSTTTPPSIYSATYQLTPSLNAVGTPPYSFSSDTDTGMWNPAGNQIGFTALGVNRVSITSSGVLAEAVKGTNGIASTSVLASIAIPATGLTNSYAVNATALVTATAISFTINNRANTVIYTSPTLTATMSVPLQPGWSIQAASGLSGTMLPW